jgi:hypothetical protein
VVSLDGRARSLEADTLNDIRVEGSLQQPLDLSLGLSSLFSDLFLGGFFNLGSLGLEDFDKGVSDDLSLLLT